MPTCGVYSVDSNSTGLSYAEEDCIKILPATPTWHAAEPNTYPNFGAQLTTVARNPINPSRQRRKGTITDIAASGGFNTDHTLRNMTRLLQGFFFADAHEKASPTPINGASTLGAVTATGYGVASGGAAYVAGQLVFGSGFGVAANNGLKLVGAGSTATEIKVTGNAVEAAPPDVARLKTVGFEFAAGDVAASLTGGLLTLTATAGTMNDKGLSVGEWVFIGGDQTTTQLGGNIGFGRIQSIAAKSITFDITTFTPVVAAGAGVSARLFFGTFIRNEYDPTLIKRRTYQLERTLGQDAAGVQSQYLIGAVPNQYTLNIPQTNKMTADLTFVACDQEMRTGLQGVKAGNRVAALGEDALNTSKDVFATKLYVLDPTTSKPAPLFGFVSQGTLVINNNVNPLKGIGVAGAFDMSAGEFDVSGTLTAFFTDTAAVTAIRNNADVGFYAAVCAKNAGVIYDVPLLSVGGGELAIQANQPVTVPVTTTAAMNAAGYTLSYTQFTYVPSVGMPQ